MYKVNGSIQDLENFSLEVIDFLVMDMGTQGYTEYMFDNDVADYIMDNAMENGEWMSYKVGHIHSHNSMNVFFSGTDMEELYDNCENHNFYLSLIVNNNHDMIAKLVYRVVPISYQALDEDGRPYKVNLQSNTTPMLMVHDCDIIRPEIIPVQQVFMDRVDYIISKPKSTHQTTGKDWGENYKGPNSGNPSPNNYSAPKSENWGGGNTGQGVKVKNLPPHDPKNGGKKWDRESEKAQQVFFSQEQLEDRGIDVTEAFTCYLLRFGEKFPNDDVELALEVLKDEKIEGLALTTDILSNYTERYSKFFNDSSTVSMEDFLLTLEEVIDFLSDHEGKYAFLPQVIKELKEFGDKIENAWKEQVFDGAKPTYVN